MVVLSLGRRQECEGPGWKHHYLGCRISRDESAFEIDCGVDVVLSSLEKTSLSVVNSTAVCGFWY